MTKEAKRTNGAGTVEQLPSGKWRVRVIIGGKRKTLGVYDDEGTARGVLASFLAQREKGEIKSSTARTLATIGDEFLTHRELNGGRKTASISAPENERSTWRNWIERAPIGSVPLDVLRASHVEAFALWLRDQNALVTKRCAVIDGKRRMMFAPSKRKLAPGTQSHALSLVRLALQYSITKDWIALNPAIGVKVAPGGRVRTLDDDWLRQPEIDQLLSCDAISIKNRTAYACAIGLALRLNDLKAIKLSDVHLDDPQYGPHVVAFVRKSKLMHRVPILPWLRPWIEAHIASRPKRSTWLFATTDGDRYGADFDFGWTSKVKAKGNGRRTRTALDRAGIARRIRFHDLRGTCATHLAMGTWGRTWSLYEIKLMLAHSDQKVTERYVRRAVDALSVAARGTLHVVGGMPVSAAKFAGALPTTVAHGDFSRPEVRETTALLDAVSLGCTSFPTLTGSREVSPDHGQPVGNAARAILAAVLSGAGNKVSPAALATLADAVLAPEGVMELAAAGVAPRAVQLAREVRELAATPVALSRAIELAGVVLAAVSPEATGASEGGSK